MSEPNPHVMSWKRWALAAICFALVGSVVLLRCLLLSSVWLPTQLIHYVLPAETTTQPTGAAWNVLAWDGIAQFGVWRLWLGQWLSHGVIPLWNPHQFGGYPLYANSQSALFYPFNWLFGILGANGFAALSLIHMVIAGMGVWALVCVAGRCRWCAGVVAGSAFILSQWYISWQYLPTLTQSASWIPWVIYAVWCLCSRPAARGAAMLGFVGGMCALSGHLQIVFYAVLAAIVTALWCIKWRDAGQCARSTAMLTASGVIAFAIAAPQVIPALTLSRHASRTTTATANGYQAYVNGAVGTEMWGMLASPILYGDSNSVLEGQTSASGYVGVIPEPEAASFIGFCVLFLAVYGVAFSRSSGKGLMLSLVVCALLLASGSILNKFLYFGIPGFASTGSPGRILVLWALGCAVLAGYGFNELWNNDKRPAWQIIITALVSAAVTIAISVSSLNKATASTSSVDIPRYVMSMSDVSMVLLAVLVIARLLRFLDQKRAIALSGVVIIAELFSVCTTLNVPGDRAELYPHSPLINQLKQITGDHQRIYMEQSRWSMQKAPRCVLPPNLATLYGLYDLQGYDSLTPISAKRVADAIAHRDAAPPENGNMQLGWPGADRQMLRRMGVAAVVTWHKEGPSIELIKNPRSILQQGDTDIAFHWDNPNQISVKSAAVSGQLLYAAPYYPGWYAQKRSGELIAFKPTSDQLMSISDSKDVVRLVFRPSDLRIGLFCAAAGWVVCCGLIISAAIGDKRLKCASSLGGSAAQ